MSGDGESVRNFVSPNAERVLNFIGMVAMLGILVGGYAYQFAYHELPCTLCQLQRAGMLAVAFGAAMNVVFGPEPRHYGVCVVSAMFGGSIAFRQTLLHVNPYFDTATAQPTLLATSNPAFGEPVAGLHLYVWSLILFSVVIVAVGAVLTLKGKAREAVMHPDPLARLATWAAAIVTVVAIAETATTFMECGFATCPNNGSWQWWLFS